MKINPITETLNFRTALGLALGMSIIVSCTNDENLESLDQSEFDEIVDSAKEDALMAEEFSSLTEFALDEVAYLETNEKSKVQSSENMPSCATIDYNQELRTLEIDFGSEGCVGNDGLLRTGRISISWTAPLFRVGSTLEVVLNDYSVEGIGIEGSKTITNVTETEGMGSFNVVVNQARVTDLEGRTRSWSSDYTVTRIAGADTLRPYDNVYETIGSSSGINRNGYAFSRTITIPLIKDRQRGCLRNYIAGELRIENERLDSAILLNFGDGTCDRIALLTYNGRTREIRLR
jgi:hypothetical protein